MRRLLTVLCLASTPALNAAPPDAILVLISDQHSAYERTAQFVAHVDRIKAAHAGVPLAVLVDGDAFELGNPVARRSQGAIDFAMFAALARRAPTVLNLGNHEPEFYDLATTVERIEATGVTVIGNLARHSSGRLFAPASTSLQLGRNTLAIAGLGIDVPAQYRAAVRRTLELANPALWARRHLPELLSREHVVPILLSHAGLRHDREILPLVPNGTLFVGAHDHTRYVHFEDRTAYVQSGAWNSHFSLAFLRRDPHGNCSWQIEQRPIAATDPAEPELAAFIRATEAANLQPEDTAVVGRSPAPLVRAEAARFVATAVRSATGADAAFIGNTTFGDGLPAGNVSRRALDACVRFDGYLCTAEVTAAQLETLLAGANQNAATPFAERRGEYLVAVGPPPPLTASRYRIATTDWGMQNRDRYFGLPGLEFTPHPELRVKAVVAGALNR